MISGTDMSVVLGTTLSDLIKASFNSVSEKATKAAKEAWSKIFEDFEPFMREAYQRNSFVRLLSQKDTDVPFADVYVQSRFSCAGKIYTDNDLLHHISDGNNVVINGNGGAGKTFFMRHLWLSLFLGETRLTPIFIELRKLNEITTIDLNSFVRRSISRKRELDDNLFSYFCDQGRFCFILDGYDEVSLSQRDSLQKQILDLSSEYPLCRFVISSRYEQRFAGWQSFDLFESVPFTLVQVKELVGKVPFDESAKKLFQKQLSEDFYEGNKSFLSNPLLAIMMMMTFKENMEIPKRMNIFYDQAFTTLYQWHDATKAFNRVKVLDIDDFQKSFAVFCLLTYHKEKFEFSKTEVIEFINQSNKVCSFTYDPEMVLKDYEESVNLLKQEGFEYVFIHRSFQEYFAAFAMVKMMPQKFPDLVQGVRKRFNDSVLPMCFEMNKSLVINGYIKVLYDKIRDSGRLVKTRGAELNYLEKLNVVFRCYLGGSSKSKRRFLFGIGLGIDEDFSELGNNIRRIRGEKIDSADVFSDILLNDRIFRLLSDFREGQDFQHDVEVQITFRHDNFVVNVTCVDQECADNVKALFERKLPQNRIYFVEVEEFMQEEIKSLTSWCKTEIAACEVREKTLEQILMI